MGHTFRGLILVGLALAQVGGFSFILVQLGLGYGIVSDFYYQLFLATAVTTMSLTPFQIMLSPFVHLDGVLAFTPSVDRRNVSLEAGRDSRFEKLSGIDRKGFPFPKYFCYGWLHPFVVGKNLAELDFRKNAGVTVVAIKRSDLIIENPMADTRFKKGDIVYVLGKQDQIAHTVKMFMAK
ncbi:MAG: hypothetical protein LC643_01470 [Bacteroidales bacterium]|nr:hypothetical protein [Bacteroidales bacterium]